MVTGGMHLYARKYHRETCHSLDTYHKVVWASMVTGGGGHLYARKYHRKYHFGDTVICNIMLRRICDHAIFRLLGVCACTDTKSLFAVNPFHENWIALKSR